MPREKKARPEHDLAFLGEIPQFERYPTYFAVGAGAGATVSLCCAQAPSPKAVTRTATIMIIFRNFNLSHLLFVAGCSGPFRRGIKEKQCFSSLF